MKRKTSPYSRQHYRPTTIKVRFSEIDSMPNKQHGMNMRTLFRRWTWLSESDIAQTYEHLLPRLFSSIVDRHQFKPCCHSVRKPLSRHGIFIVCKIFLNTVTNVRQKHCVTGPAHRVLNTNRAQNWLICLLPHKWKKIDII